MPMGSSFNKQAVRPTELGSVELGGGGVGLRTRRTKSSSVVCNRPLPASFWMSEKEGLVRGVPRQNVGRQGRRPAEGDVTHCRVARRFRLLFGHHVKNAQRNRRTAILQRRHRHPTSQVQAVYRQGGVESVREEFPQPLHSRGRTVLAPSGPTRRQGQGSRPWADPAVAVGLTTGC